MGLIGNLVNLLASGSRYVPPPPPTTPQTGPDSTRSTSAAPPAADGAPPPAPATTATTGTTNVQPSLAAPSAAAQSVPRQGTPADTSPLRADFSLVAQAPDVDSARAYAIAAQSRERLQNLVDGLAEGPQATPTLTVVPAEKPEPANAGADALNSTLSNLRGEKVAGAVLDKVA